MHASLVCKLIFYKKFKFWWEIKTLCGMFSKKFKSWSFWFKNFRIPEVFEIKTSGFLKFWDENFRNPEVSDPFQKLTSVCFKKVFHLHFDFVLDVKNNTCFEYELRFSIMSLLKAYKEEFSNDIFTKLQDSWSFTTQNFRIPEVLRPKLQESWSFRRNSKINLRGLWKNLLDSL